MKRLTNFIVLEAIIFIFVFTHTLFAIDPATEKGGVSSNGEFKVEFRDSCPTLYKKIINDNYEEISKVEECKLGQCHHLIAFVSDNGRFAVIAKVPGEIANTKVVAIYTKGGALVNEISCNDILNKEEISKLPPSGSACHAPFETWCKDEGAKVKNEVLCIETLRGREVDIDLVTGRVVENKKVDKE